MSLAPNHHPGPSPSQSSGDGVPHVQSSVAGAVFNFVNSIIGAGIIGLPYALREAGLGAGVLLLFVIASLTLYSIQLIVALGVASRQYDYEALCEHAFGARGFYAIMLAMFLFAMGAMIAYLVILSDSAVVRVLCVLP